MAKHWKNGIAVTLSSGPESAFGQSIAITGTDIYEAGYRLGNSNGESSVAQYWKNGTSVSLNQWISICITE
ncbi:hypothetical protein ACFOWA_17540 [Pedobacter lithocola]|uniref:Uncharacterized protein n=1 Tax=Pedobacter lithocola TaxID=1908239 RepID=A0ABV8PDC2_9SPHI